MCYSAAASLVASGALVAGAPQALADGSSRTLNCVMDDAGDFCNIDFDGVVFYTSFGGGNWGAPQGHATDPAQGAYVGGAFTLDGGGTHYGWIELYIPSNDNVTVKRIGYDTTVGASIPTVV